MTNTNLASLFEANYDLAASETFSRDTYRALGEIRAEFSTDDVEALYNRIDGTITSFSRHIDFVKRGLSSLANARAKRFDRFGITPNVAYRLHEILEDIEMDIPAWLPRAYRRDAEAGSSHRYLFLFNWATVPVTAIPDRHYSYFMLRLQEQLSPATSPKRPQATSALKKPGGEAMTEASSPTPPKSQPEPATPASSPVRLVPQAEAAPTSAENETVAHGMYVAKKYLMMAEAAKGRGLEFSLSIEEMSALLKTRVCYYTDADLVVFPHDREAMKRKGEALPGNYLTLDRKDNNKGYVSGNVVACSQEINKLKDQMSAVEFERTVSMKKLLEQGNFSSEQLAALTVLMKSSTGS